MNTKRKNYNVDILLKQALSSSETPDAELVQKVKYDLMKEEPILRKSTIKRSFSGAAAVIATFLIITTTALAAWYFLKPSEVAERFENRALSAAFESEAAVNINASVTSGDYTFTLLAIVNGKDITDMPYCSKNVQDERIYAVVAIQNADGTPMPATSDDEYGQVSFFASPFIKGLEPWLYNAVTMNGGYSETVVDGIMYRIVECDGVSMFADRGLYFAMCTGAFYSSNAFTYNEQTGEIVVNPDYDGASVVFDLPLDKTLADPEKARQYIDNLFTEPVNDIKDEADTNSANAENLWSDMDWDKAVPVASTVKELTVSENGAITFTYDFEHGGGTITVDFNDYFVGNQTAQSAVVHQIASDDILYAIRFSMDEDGSVTGMVIMPE